jgi:flavin-dependent dehydrogenase
MPDTLPLPQTELDAVVIGGGPAGATAAALIAKQGRRVRLFERDRFPRFHIGESLIPETYWVFKRLGMLEKMKASRFVHKHSVQFVATSGKESAPFYFWDNKPHESSQTWQVVRSEFDKLILDHARECGADVREGVRVREVLFEGSRAVGVKIQLPDGSLEEVRAKVVVDASGQSAMLQTKFKLRIWDPVLRKGAIWTYFEGAHRETGRDEGATMVIQTADGQGWFWYIPLHDNRVSVGVVGPFDHLFKGRGGHEKVFNEEVERCVAVKRRVAGGRRMTGYFATKDFSYRARQVAGDGWVLVGDAFGFLDPLYSSGVLLALKSGELAADAIVEGHTSAAQLGHWGPDFNRGIDRMRRLVCEFYDQFSFGKFVQKFPHLNGTITDLLVGEIFTDKVDKVWAPMESMYPPGKAPPPAWDTGSTDALPDKAIDIVVPEGALL